MMKWFEDDASALLRLAEVASEHGSAEQTLWLTEALLGDMRSYNFVFVVTPDFVQLENGYYSLTAEPVLDRMR